MSPPARMTHVVAVSLKWWMLMIESAVTSGLGLGASQVATVSDDLNVSVLGFQGVDDGTHSLFWSDILTRSMVARASVGPTVHKRSSLAGSQQVEVMSAWDHWPKRMLRRLRMVDARFCVQSAGPRLCVYSRERPWLGQIVDISLRSLSSRWILKKS